MRVEVVIKHFGNPPQKSKHWKGVLGSADDLEIVDNAAAMMEIVDNAAAELDSVADAATELDIVNGIFRIFRMDFHNLSIILETQNQIS